MAASKGSRFGRTSGGIDQIVATLLEQLNHLRRNGRVVGRVSIDHQVKISVDVSKHPPHHVTLSGPLLMDDVGSRSTGNRGRVVIRLIVADKKIGFGQMGSKATYHRLDSRCF